MVIEIDFIVSLTVKTEFSGSSSTGCTVVCTMYCSCHDNVFHGLVWVGSRSNKTHSLSQVTYGMLILAKCSNIYVCIVVNWEGTLRCPVSLV